MQPFNITVSSGKVSNLKINSDLNTVILKDLFKA